VREIHKRSCRKRPEPSRTTSFTSSMDTGARHPRTPAGEHLSKWGRIERKSICSRTTQLDPTVLIAQPGTYHAATDSATPPAQTETSMCRDIEDIRRGCRRVSASRRPFRKKMLHLRILHSYPCFPVRTLWRLCLVAFCPLLQIRVSPTHHNHISTTMC